MSYDTYRLIFIGAAIACGVMFLVSVTLFFVFKIPNIIGNLTGRNAKKAIEDIKRQNESYAYSDKANALNGKKKITVKIEENNNNKVHFSIFNTGENIAEEDLDRIWVRFYKVDSSRNRETGGSGIGLALVKAIMNNYNQKYGVQNKENGVEFYFEIGLENSEK